MPIHIRDCHAATRSRRTVAIARGRDKEKLARQLGAHVYLDSQSQDVPAELMRLGGAKTILATVTPTLNDRAQCFFTADDELIHWRGKTRLSA